MDLRELLEQLRAGKVSVDGVLEKLEQPAEVNLGFAHVDLQRRQRCGFPEVIFCQSKSCSWVEGVVEKLVEAAHNTRNHRYSASRGIPKLRQALALSEGSFMTFVERPVSAVLLLMALVVIVVAVLPAVRKGREEAFQE